jgi:predicted regulator of Ras-like GTPase activity (Roadblock/LC7/MglB family)
MGSCEWRGSGGVLWLGGDCTADPKDSGAGFQRIVHDVHADAGPQPPCGLFPNPRQRLVPGPEYASGSHTNNPVNSLNPCHLVNSNISSQKIGTNRCRAVPLPPASSDQVDTAMLKCVLEEFLQIEGVNTAALVATDGFLIDYVGSEPTDKDALAALGSCAMQFFSRTGSALEMGPVRQSVLEYGDGTIIFTQIGDEELLAVITGTESTLGCLAYILPKITTRVAALI